VCCVAWQRSHARSASSQQPVPTCRRTVRMLLVWSLMATTVVPAHRQPPGPSHSERRGRLEPSQPAPSEVWHFSQQLHQGTPLGFNLAHAGSPSCVAGHPCNTDMLQVVCLNTPSCEGFSSDGWLKNSTIQTVHSETDLFSRVAGAPPQFHFLEVPGFDAVAAGGDLGHDDDPQSACMADPRCAGYNSNGYLKACVAVLAGNQPCDLFLKVGGAEGAPLPSPLPAPPPAPPPGPPPPGPWRPRIWPLPRRYSNGSAVLTVRKPARGVSLFALANPSICPTLTSAFGEQSVRSQLTKNACRSLG
jgi:hypothetical protein